MNLSDNKIASLKASILLAAAVALAAGTALGTERLWVGESGASWYSDSSWSPAGKPGQSDTCIFRPDGELTVVISGGTSVCRVGELRFESGKTAFAPRKTSTSTPEVSLTAKIKPNTPNR